MCGCLLEERRKRMRKGKEEERDGEEKKGEMERGRGWYGRDGGVLMSLYVWVLTGGEEGEEEEEEDERGRERKNSMGR